MFFTKNIKFLRKRRQRTQGEVADAVGLKRSTLSGYENGVAQPGIEALLALSKYFGIAIDTLVRQDLSALSDYQLSELERGVDIYVRGSQLRVLATTVNDDNEENIELVQEKARAGYTQGFADPEFIKELPTFQLPFLPRERKYRTFQIKGDSMLPIPEGSWVTGEFVQDWHQIKNNAAYIILTLDDGIVFKIVTNQLQTHQRLKLYSLNPEYAPYELPVEEIKEVWKFVNYISATLPEPIIKKDDLVSTIAAMRKDIMQLKKQLPR